MNNLFKIWTIRRPKLSKKVWIKFKELDKYFSLVVWLYRLDTEMIASLKYTWAKVKSLIKSSGWNFAFLYLKECQRLTIAALSGRPEPKFLKGVCVSRDTKGFPLILDRWSRTALRRGALSCQLYIRALLNILSVFRVFPTNVRPSLTTVLSPFNGVVKTFDNSIVKMAVKDLLGRRVFSLSKPKLILMESAGPNGFISTQAAGFDALALLFKGKFLLYVKILFNKKAYAPLLSILACSMMYPVWYILYISKLVPALNLGKIGVVYDQAGKARVIGITNYWAQLILKPLHDGIFSILERIIPDGTFDQAAPFDILINRCAGKVFHCFDLSAATDRIPLELQVDILNSLSKDLGNEWKSILNFPYVYKSRDIYYAVGQPMGAYSSWAMLALTHHVIVRIAALRVGLKRFEDYAIIGDDIVIANDDVARVYLELMSNLGVGINLGKSTISPIFGEFAKTWRGPGVNITPVGPGLILRVIRDSFYYPTLLMDLVRLSIVTEIDPLLSYIDDLKLKFPKKGKLIMVSVWAAMVSPSFRWLTGTGNANIYFYDAIRYTFSASPNSDVTRFSLNQASLNMLDQERLDSFNTVMKNYDSLIKLWFRQYLTSGPLMLLELAFKLVGPAFWAYTADLFDKMIDLNKPLNIRRGAADYMSILVRLSETSSLNSIDIDWTNRKKVKISYKSFNKFVNYYNESYIVNKKEIFERYHVEDKSP